MNSIARTSLTYGDSMLTRVVVTIGPTFKGQAEAYGGMVGAIW